MKFFTSEEKSEILLLFLPDIEINLLILEITFVLNNNNSYFKKININLIKRMTYYEWIENLFNYRNTVISSVIR